MRFRIMIYKLYKILIYTVISIVLTNQALSETKLLGTEKYWKAYSTKLDKAINADTKQAISTLYEVGAKNLLVIPDKFNGEKNL